MIHKIHLNSSELINFSGNIYNQCDIFFLVVCRTYILLKYLLFPKTNYSHNISFIDRYKIKKLDKYHSTRQQYIFLKIL